MTVGQYREKPHERKVVRALRLRDVGEDQWDEVCDFLGADLLSGKIDGLDGEVRRPRQGEPGFVAVTYGPPGRWAHNIEDRATAGDWLTLPADAADARDLVHLSDERFHEVYAPDDPWHDDAIQFPRFICEIAAAGPIWQPGDMTALAESMDLTPEQISELFERAHVQWEAAKAAAR